MVNKSNVFDDRSIIDETAISNGLDMMTRT